MLLLPPVLLLLLVSLPCEPLGFFGMVAVLVWTGRRLPLVRTTRTRYRSIADGRPNH